MTGQLTYGVEVDRASGVFNVVIDYMIGAYVDPETGEYFGDTAWTADIRTAGGPPWGQSGFSGESGWVPIEFGLSSDAEVAQYTLDFVASNTFSGEKVSGSWTVFAAGLDAGPVAITGTDGDDIIVGSAENDVIGGGAGDDLVAADAGDDTVDGGDGADRLDGGAGDDLLSGGLGDDIFYVDSAGDLIVERAGEGEDLVFATVDYAVSANVERLILVKDAVQGTGAAGAQWIQGNLLANRLSGLGGDDTLRGEAGDDRLFGGLGADRLDGGTGADRMTGGAGDDRYAVDDAGDRVVEAAGGGFDTVEVSNLSRYALGAHVEALEWYGLGAFVGVGNALDNRLVGGADRDVLSGRLGDDTLEGRAGDDRLIGGEGGDRLIGGDGQDTADYSGSDDGVRVDLRSGRGRGGDAHKDELEGVENLIGSAHDDRLTGSDLANRLVGGLGDDRIRGGEGDDVIVGGAGADRLDGDQGRDTLSYAGSTRGGVTVDLSRDKASGGDAAGDRIKNFENVLGGAGDDRLTGDAGDNLLAGGAGADRLDGGAGSDTVSYVGSAGGVTVDLALQSASGGQARGDVISGFENALGGAGNDKLGGGGGANTLNGGAGDDVIRGRGGDDLINGGAGADDMDGGLGRDTLSYVGSVGTVFVDLEMQIAYSGDAAGDKLSGFEDAQGGESADGLYGDAGVNRLSGGAGGDHLDGRSGDDRLTGGGGADMFYFAAGYGHDVVVDFEEGDRLQFDYGPGAGTFEAVMVFARSTGANGEHTLFDFGAYSVLLLDVAKDSLSAQDVYVSQDFIF